MEGVDNSDDEFYFIDTTTVVLRFKSDFYVKQGITYEETQRFEPIQDSLPKRFVFIATFYGQAVGGHATVGDFLQELKREKEEEGKDETFNVTPTTYVMARLLAINQFRPTLWSAQLMLRWVMDAAEGLVNNRSDVMVAWNRYKDQLPDVGTHGVVPNDVRASFLEH